MALALTLLRGCSLLSLGLLLLLCELVDLLVEDHVLSHRDEDRYVSQLRLLLLWLARLLSLLLRLLSLLLLWLSSGLLLHSS